VFGRSTGDSGNRSSMSSSSGGGSSSLCTPNSISLRPLLALH
jgi:hypothetical protein